MRSRLCLGLTVVAATAFSACSQEEGHRDLGSVSTEDPAQEDPIGDGDANANDPVSEGGSGVRKALGGTNGDGDYCDSGGCTAGEGDCDSNAQCVGLGADGRPLVCVADSGGRFAAYSSPFAAGTAAPRNNQQDDHCMPQHCSSRGLDGDETGLDCGGSCGNCNPSSVPVPGGLGTGMACELADGHADRCTYHCQCASGSGDCDANTDCEGWDLPDPSLRAVCVADVGQRFPATGAPATADFCLPAHCRDRVQNFGEDQGVDAGGACGSANCPSLVAGNECTPSCPCSAGGGDCDSNLDCAAGLVCMEEGAVDRCRTPGGQGAPLDCNAIHIAQPAAPTGVYTIDPDGAGPLEPIQTVCDMTFSGGGWTMIYSSPPTENGLPVTPGPVLPGSYSILPQPILNALTAIQPLRSVHIRGSGNLNRSATSVPGSLPFQNLAGGFMLNHTGYNPADWTGPFGTGQFLSFSCPIGSNDLYPNIYWACGNVGGLHIVGQHHEWDWEVTEAMEVFVH